MLQLPVELRQHCINFLDDTDALKAVRLVSKELSAVATETLFHTAVLHNEEESATCFRKLVHSPLRTLIRRVAIHTSDDPLHQDGGQEEAELQRSFIKAFVALPQIENLREVKLNFAVECAVEGSEIGWDKEVAETEEFRKTVLRALFRHLAQAEKVETLSISNLQDAMPEKIFNDDNFRTVRGRLTKLALRITAESDDAAPENSITMPALHRGFRDSLPDIWLKPMTNQLTHLTIYGSGCMWGVWPLTDFRKIPPFPRLRSLSFGNWTIAHDWQIDWILAHAPTLEELFLDDCPIVIALRMEHEEANANFPDLDRDEHESNIYSENRYYKEIDMRWHHVLDRLRTGLPLLQRFAMGSGDWDEGTEFHGRYALKSRIHDSNYHMFDCGIGPSQWMDFDHRYGSPPEWTFGIAGDANARTVRLPARDEDHKALDALLEAVRRRAGGG
jgi:hypothetical protein